ncbi:MAG: hypothetical protein F4W91_23645 [Gemmatimonadetes bacterium]|nr:hypothetical protein [Gemmatimonadota bacterium]
MKCIHWVLCTSRLAEWKLGSFAQTKAAERNVAMRGKISWIAAYHHAAMTAKNCWVTGVVLRVAA